MDRAAAGATLAVLSYIRSRPAIVGAVVGALRSGEASLISDLVQGQWEQIDVHMIAEAARRETGLDYGLIEQLIRFLGAAVVNLINLFDPECVFLGRGVANATADLILEPIRAIVAERAFSVAARHISRFRWLLLAMMSQCWALLALSYTSSLANRNGCWRH